MFFYLFSFKGLLARGLLAILLFMLVACGMLPAVKEEQDSGPKEPLSVDHIPIPIPRVEPITKAGNYSPYTVLGKTYTVIKNPQGFRQRGYASWYGKKFHGRKTSNGEVYDMFAVTAAHKTLPIPCFVRVTNLSNNRSIIVRVNDRGPFHEGRIIDLSYTAAKKLDVIKQGTAPVSVEYIDPLTFQLNHPTNLDNTQHTNKVSTYKAAPTPINAGGYQLPRGTYLQMGAFSKREGAARYKATIDKLLSSTLAAINQKDVNKKEPVTVELLTPRRLKLFKDNLYRVQIGPVKNQLDIHRIKKTLSDAGIKEPHTVNRFE